MLRERLLIGGHVEQEAAVADVHTHLLQHTPVAPHAEDGLPARRAAFAFQLQLVPEGLGVTAKSYCTDSVARFVGNRA